MKTKEGGQTAVLGFEKWGKGFFIRTHALIYKKKRFSAKNLNIF